MIQPHELRKGNMVIHVDSGIARLITVGYIDAWLDIIFHEEYYTAPRHKILYEKMEPIPLTEAVLMAAGFELFPEGYYFNFGCVVYKDFMRDGSGKWEGFTCNHSLRPLKGLHDLQNVFYFLRGKELEINMEELKKAVG